MHNQFSGDPERLLLPMDPARFQAELQEYGTPGHYVRELIKGYEQPGQLVVESLSKLVPVAVAPDASEITGQRTMAGQLFFIGGLLGLRVMELERGAPFMSGLYSPPVWLPDPEFSETADRSERRRRYASIVMAVSEDGYREAEPYHATIEHIGSGICTTVDQEPFVRRGFGLTMYMARQVVERNRVLDAVADLGLMRFEVELAATVDWDAAWAKLQKESD